MIESSENLPFTGIDQVFMIHKQNFARSHKEFEPLNEGSVFTRPCIEDYRVKELNR